jgi:uncharacterized protein (DUF3820 family)
MRNLFEEYKKNHKPGTPWNPPPRREDLGKGSRLKLTIDERAGFINCAQGYFNVGKYKGVQVNDVPLWYLKWVVDKIQLNPTELNLIRIIIKNK